MRGRIVAAILGERMLTDEETRQLSDAIEDCLTGFGVGLRDGAVVIEQEDE